MASLQSVEPGPSSVLSECGAQRKVYFTHLITGVSMITVTFTIILIVITITQIQNLLKRQIKVHLISFNSQETRNWACVCLTVFISHSFHLNAVQEEDVRELGCERRSVYVGGLGRLSREESRNQAGTGDFL